MAKYIVVHSVRVCTEFVPETVGRLTTLGPSFLVRDKNRRRLKQVCGCACGSVLITDVSSLHNAKSQSCGCRQREAASVNGINRRTHGQTKTPEYTSWVHMKARCCNTNTEHYAEYGGRGITYCERWKKFENFFADMGLKPSPTHTLDRYPDLDGNYEPSNCRWADKREQANNRRTNRMVTIGDKTDTVANWCRTYGQPHAVVRLRMRRGWDLIRALTTPVRSKRSHKHD